MNLPAEVTRMSVTEFLEWEAQQPQKYELHNGVVYPHEIYNRVGARRTHATIALNIAASISCCRPRPCSKISDSGKTHENLWRDHHR